MDAVREDAEAIDPGRDPPEEAGGLYAGEVCENCAELPTAADITKPEMDLSAFDANLVVSVEAP